MGRGIGSGELNDPFLISTVQDLNRIGHNPRLMQMHFGLKNNIDLTGIHFFIIGSEVFPFQGIFDGNGFEISNLTYTSTSVEYVGLFGVVGGVNAELRNLGLTNSIIDGASNTGIGSLVGKLSRGTITNCRVKDSSVSGYKKVGGLVGVNSSGSISNCYTTGSVSAVRYNVGGLVGSNEASSSRITNCYSAASVVATSSSGGLVGGNYGKVTASFWDIEASGHTKSDGGVGKTTAEMQMESTFVSWGCDPVWTINEGVDYPRLWWENMTGKTITFISPLVGEFVCPVGITMLDFSFLAEHWLDDSCDMGNDYCEGTDIDLSGMVDINDLETFTDNWLAGIAP